MHEVLIANYDVVFSIFNSQQYVCYFSS